MAFTFLCFWAFFQYTLIINIIYVFIHAKKCFLTYPFAFILIDSNLSERLTQTFLKVQKGLFFVVWGWGVLILTYKHCIECLCQSQESLNKNRKCFHLVFSITYWKVVGLPPRCCWVSSTAYHIELSLVRKIQDLMVHLTFVGLLNATICGTPQVLHGFPKDVCNLYCYIVSLPPRFKLNQY